MKEIVVRSLGELIDRTTPNEPDPASGRLRDTSVYRGVSDPTGRLLTSLDRLDGFEPHSKAHLEEHLLRNFVRYGRTFLENANQLWDIMVTAEHHGLPTRLLDWTHSPIIAAHFATLTQRPGADCVVWKLNWKRMHECFGLRPFAFMAEDLDDALRERNLPIGWDFLKTTPSPDQTFVCLLDPTAVTHRVEVQSGSFTFSMDKDRSLDAVLEEAGITDVLTRFILPTNKAQFVRDQLDLCTVDERRLFPGLDGIAAQLKRYYSSTGPERDLPWPTESERKEKRRVLGRNPRPPSP